MNHARRICLLLAVLFMLTAVFAACEPGTDVETDEATGGKNKNEDTPNPYADDDTVYHSKCFAGDCVYFAQRDTGGMADHLVFTMLDYPGDMYYACPDPTCPHAAGSLCQFLDVRVLCVVMRDGRPPVLYIKDGAEVREFDTGTGVSRRVGRTEFKRSVSDSWFYQGKLYMYTNDDNVPGRPFTGIAMLDTVTKKLKYFEAGDHARMFGIYNDRVWYITGRNVICSCALDFSDVREEYDVGIEEKDYQINEYTLQGFIDGGMIYFERNCHEPEKFAGDAFVNSDIRFDTTTLSDVYVLDADNIGAGERLVAEGVIQFVPHNGDLYYTKMDYDHYEESETYDYKIYEGESFESSGSGKTYKFDGGTLYRYEHESGKNVTICEDIGTNFSAIDNSSATPTHRIIDITDDYVFFGGRQYRDLDDELKNRDCCNYMCQLDIKTGEWKVLVKRADVPWGTVF